MKFGQNIWFQFNFQNYLLKISYFVKKIILNINFIKVAYAKGKINENQKRSEKKTKKQKQKAKLGLALKRWQKIFEPIYHISQI